MKTTRDYYRERFEAEKATFIKVMKAVPAEKATYKPHPQSTSANELLWWLAVELRVACDAIDHGECVLSITPVPGVDECVATYEKHAATLQSRLASLDDKKWEGPSKLIMDGKVIWETTVGEMLFGFLFDAIHHRGQLSSYLRPMGAKVPSIYGPSADDPGM